MDIRAIVEETLVAPMRAMAAQPRMTIAEEHAATNEAIEQMQQAAKGDYILHIAPCDVELLLKRIERLRMLADAYRRVSAKHESMVGDLRDALNADDLDKARDIVSAEYDAIHGPNG
jgi:hypothetical protein